jgi:hypothetical protein
MWKVRLPSLRRRPIIRLGETAPFLEATARERMVAGKGTDGSGGRGKRKNPVPMLGQGKGASDKRSCANMYAPIRRG